MSNEAKQAQAPHRIALITGANSGIGAETALSLAKQNYHLYLACRNEAETQKVIDDIKSKSGNQAVEMIKLDLSSLASVRQAARTFNEKQVPLHLLINNAGLASLKGVTADGLEITSGVNHFGHFLFTILLMPHLRRAAAETGEARIVHVASKAQQRSGRPNWAAMRQPGSSAFQLDEYKVSKLLNVLFSNELARRLDGTGITSNSLHPGVVASSIWREVPGFLRGFIKLFMKNNEQGAAPSLMLATDPKLKGVTGKYYDYLTESSPNPLALDPALQKETWEESIKLAGVTDEELRAAGF